MADPLWLIGMASAGFWFGRQVTLKSLSRQLTRLEEKIMAEFQAMKEQIERMSAQVADASGDIDALQAEVETLKAQLSEGGMTVAQETELQAAIDTLEAQIAAAAAKKT